MGLLKAARKTLMELTSWVTNEWTPPDIDKLPDLSKDQLKNEIDFEPPVDPKTLVSVLTRYGIHGTFKDFRIGSSVTTYEIEVPVGTRFSTVIKYRNDIARDLKAPSLRIIESVEKSFLVGLEVENPIRYTVGFKSMFKGIPEGLVLPLILGEDTYGAPVYRDLTDMPHLLVAGQTGSGKSVFLNTLIMTLISKMTPEQVRFLLIDPKQVEFTAYHDIPHLFEKDGEPLVPANNTEEARYLLDVIVDEMEERFTLMSEKRVKKIEDYNKVSKKKLPYVVFVVDEFSDLMMMGDKKEAAAVEGKIVRVAQKARAVGIHMILATQKPLVKIMTSLIKANMPARVAFSVTSGVDSRVILDESGAEALTGKGDMLFRDPTARGEYARLKRVQAPWIGDSDINLLLGSA